jgi:hypothetical protein
MGYLEEQMPCDIKVGDIVWADHGMAAIVLEIDSLFPYQALCARTDGQTYYEPCGRAMRRAPRNWYEHLATEAATRTAQGTWTPVPDEYRD